MSSDVKYYSLTHPQKGIWYTEKLYPGTSIGIVAATIKIKHEIDLEIFEKALNLFLLNNDSMRLRFAEIDGEPCQYVSGYQFYRLEAIEFPDSEKLYRWDAVQTQTPFPSLDSDLFYFAFVRTDDGTSGLYFKIHHLIGDAWSSVLLVNELFKYYGGLLKGIENVEPETCSYLDYIDGEKVYERSGRFASDREFWNGKFENIPELTVLKLLKREETSLRSKRRTFVLPKRLSAKLRQCCQENKTSIIAFIMSSVAIYINRVTGREEVVFGTPILNRSNAKDKNTLGMFVSTVPVRIKVDESLDYLTYSGYILKEWMSVLKHQKYPYNLLLKDIREKDRGVEKLYDIIVSYQNAKLIKENPGSYEARWHPNGYQLESLCIHVNDREDDGNIIFDYDYLSDLFYSKEIEFIHDHISRLLWHALDNPFRRLPEIEMVSEREKYRILHEFSGRTLEYDRGKVLQALFEEQAAANAGRAALVFEEESMTYGGLNERANRLAGFLRKAGAARNAVVGLRVNRSFEMIVGMLGILKAGGAYLPIVPELPRDRAEYMLADSGCKLLLANTGIAGDCFPGVKTIDILSDEIEEEDGANPVNINSPEDLAYVIYTSGSTGSPKGAMIEHRSVNNLIRATMEEIDYRSRKVLAITTMSFDVSVLETVLPLAAGGTVIIASEEEQRDNRLLAKSILKNHADILHITPSRLQLFMDDATVPGSIKSLTELIIGGEVPSQELLQYLAGMEKTRVYNVYGPTEATVQATLKRVGSENPFNIGRPLGNVKIYILDKHSNIAPIGISGEICIGGEGLARGYAGKAGMNAGKFIASPFDPNERLYRTGDLGRWFSEGDIEFLGRIDNQIKINGYRIQLEEIENALIKAEGIKEAAVLVRSRDGRKCLCAFIVPDAKISLMNIKDCLAKKLPYYMIPSYFVRIDRMPLNPNGKVDKKALELIDGGMETGNKHVRPRNRMERILAECWQKVLGIKRVGIDDNFFTLGADSMAVIRVQSLVFRYGWEASTQDFYKYPSIRRLAEVLDGRNGEKAEDGGAYTPEISNGSIRSRYFGGRIESVLITGATGFLGVHLLDEIHTRTDARIYCLVRGEDQAAVEEKLYGVLDFYFDGKYSKSRNAGRIVAVRGDVSLENFGIPEAQYESLSSEVDAIIHSAAVVKHFGEYEEFDAVNIKGTKEAVAMAERHGKLLFHISTASVLWFMNDLQELSQELSSNVYLKSKLEAEHIVTEGIRSGLSACIIRVGNLTGRYMDGMFQINIEKNAFYNRLKSYIEIGAVPDSKIKSLLELTPVDYCCRAIFDIIYKRRETGKVYNIYNGKYISMEDFVVMINSLGFDIKVLKNDLFNTYINNLLKRSANYPKLDGIINEIGSQSDMTAYMGVYPVREDKQFYWPDIDREYILKIVGHMKKVNYLTS